MTDRQLINMAAEAAETAYVPYSRIEAGAAVECRDGSVFTGCSVENAVQSCSACAEQTAVLCAVSSGKTDFVRIAVWANTADYPYPCGSCCQLLSEFAPSVEVLCARSDGHYVSYRLAKLFPFPPAAGSAGRDK